LACKKDQTVTQPLLSATDTMPLREALRGLRFLLRRGRDTVADTLSLDALPKPASSLATVVLREADDLAKSVDAIASKAIKTVLGRQGSSSASLDQIILHDGAEVEFARAIYLALGTVLRRLGAESAFVSEMSARACFDDWRQGGPTGEPSEWLADLALRLRDARVIRGTQADKQGAAPVQDVEALAIFAVLLWLQSSRSEAENEAALDSAADITRAKSTEIAAAIQANSKDAVAALFGKYVSHV
jgi:hypothetical protein